jgi:glycosyltransferase involved in cell wall biosynthesis
VKRRGVTELELLRSVLPLVGAFAALLIGWHLIDLRRALREPTLLPAPHAGSTPLVTVIIPARNEAVRIGACLACLAQQSYRNFELIIVDDSSTDGTGDIVRQYAAALPRLQLIAGAPLPEGWVGKCWAIWQAAEHARGEWLLFLDADVVPSPQFLTTLVARSTSADLLSLVPLLHVETLAERVVLPAFAGLLSAIYRFERVNDPRSREAFAIGQCLFVRRAAYAAVGGHAAVRGNVLEDMELAARLKHAHYRCMALAAPDLLTVRMYDGWGSLSEGLQKNAIAGLRHGGARARRTSIRLMLMALLPWYAIVAGALLLVSAHNAPIAQAFIGAGLALLSVGALCQGILIQRRHRISPAWGFLFPVGLVIYFGLAFTAFVRLRRGRGVRWKGRILTGE